MRSEMYLQHNSILSWPRRILRDLYYRLITLLERRENAARTSLRYTWDQNGEQMKEIFTNILRNKKVREGTAT